mgnify:CR=1 FL=1
MRYQLSTTEDTNGTEKQKKLPRPQASSVVESVVRNVLLAGAGASEICIIRAMRTPNCSSGLWDRQFVSDRDDSRPRPSRRWPRAASSCNRRRHRCPRLVTGRGPTWSSTPDPDIVALDPRFRRYIVGNTVIRRLHFGTLWAEGRGLERRRPVSGVERHPEQRADAMD